MRESNGYLSHGELSGAEGEERPEQSCCRAATLGWREALFPRPRESFSPQSEHCQLTLTKVDSPSKAPKAVSDTREQTGLTTTGQRSGLPHHQTKPPQVVPLRGAGSEALLTGVGAAARDGHSLIPLVRTGDRVGALMHAVWLRAEAHQVDAADGAL